MECPSSQLLIRMAPLAIVVWSCDNHRRAPAACTGRLVLSAITGI